MNKIIANSNIDFADSEFRSFVLTEDNNLIIYLTSWDEKLLTIIFSTPIHFLYDLGDGITNIFEIVDKTPLLDKALASHYIKIPSDHPFKLFVIEDRDDFPFIQIVAASITVSKGVRCQSCKFVSCYFLSKIGKS